MRSSYLAAVSLGLAALIGGAGAAQAQAGGTSKGASVERGRYLVKIAGCNDCHTPGYAQTGGDIPEMQWLVGDQLGWRGEWGTTYPSNLRLHVQKISEAEWIKAAKTTVLRPPMPWFVLRDMTEQDLASIYRFIRHLGPAGEPAPAYLPPDKQPQGPYVQFPAPPKQ